MTVRTEIADPEVLTPERAAALLAGAPWRRLATVGDSVAEGVRDPAEGYRDLSWIDRIEEALRLVHPDLATLNLGRRDLLVAEIRATQLDLALAFEPDLAIVVGGGNDMFRRHFDPGHIRAELAAMVGPLRERGSDVVTIGLFDIARSGLADERYRDVMSERTHLLTEQAASVAAEYGAVHVSFTDHPACADPGIYAADRVHLNARGHAIAATGTIQALATVSGG